MHAQICEFPSETLYSSKLRSHESVASHLLDDLPNASAESEDDSKELLQTPVVFFDTAGCEYFERVNSTDGDEGSRTNENEATVVSNWVDKLVCTFLTSWLTLSVVILSDWCGYRLFTNSHHHTVIISCTPLEDSDD